jgi:hypothetical protein
LKRFFTPGLVVALFLLVYLGAVLAHSQGDPLSFARLGDGFRNGRPLGREGYDGQFAYFIALDPRPAAVAEHLDVPAYRYQRILYPLLARLLALGQPALIPWMLVIINAAALVAGTYLVERWLLANRLSRWYALTYGLWIGVVSAVRVDVSEPLCFVLIIAALLTRRRWLAAIWLALALLAKETALLFVAAFWLSAVFEALAQNRRPWLSAPRAVLGVAAWASAPFALSLLPFTLLQALLYGWFGAVGVTSGGYMATPFEVIPYMGLWRVGVSNPFALATTLIFGLLVVIPSVWGVVTAVRRLLQRDFSPAVWSLAATAGFLPFTPFSTFREAGGIMRLATGLVVAVLFVCAQTRSKKVLNYSLIWLAGLAFIFKE